MSLRHAAAVLVLCLVALPLSAQTWVVYDDFKRAPIDPARWVDYQPICQNALDCVRQIQGGQLRLWIRGYGLTGNNSGNGISWSRNGLEVAPSEWGITGIGAQLTVTRATGNSCPGIGSMVGQVGLRAVFFNVGEPGTDLVQSNDVEANLFMYPHPDQTFDVGGILHKYGAQEYIGSVTLSSSVKVGESVAISLRWDKANKHVVYGLQRFHQPPVEQVISYADLPDTHSIWYPYKSVSVQTSPQNCASGLVFSDMEVSIAQVTVSQ